MHLAVRGKVNYVWSVSRFGLQGNDVPLSDSGAVRTRDPQLRRLTHFNLFMNSHSAFSNAIQLSLLSNIY